MKQRIRVLLADDHPMFLDGVKNALSLFEDIDIVVKCTDGDAVITALESIPVDVAVLDINIPSQNGIALAKVIRKEYAHIKVVFLTMYLPAALGSDAPHSYALGYVLKNSGSQVLHNAIQSVFMGYRFTDPKLAEASPQDVPETFPHTVKLSRREKEIIRLVKDGKGNKEIADTLFLSELTIKTHRKNIYQKLDVNNVAALLIRVRGIELD